MGGGNKNQITNILLLLTVESQPGFVAAEAEEGRGRQSEGEEREGRSTKGKVILASEPKGCGN